MNQLQYKINSYILINGSLLIDLPVRNRGQPWT